MERPRKGLRHFYKEYKAIVIVVFVVLVYCFIAVRIKTTHCFEENEIVENIVECTLNVCLSIIAAFVFFIFQGYLQDKRRRMLYSVRIHGFIIVNILDNLRIIKKKLDKNELDIENTRMILNCGYDAYNNLFQCIDSYQTFLDEELLEVLIKLTDNKLLQNLYYLYRNPDSMNKFESLVTDKYNDGFTSMVEKLERLNKELWNDYNPDES